MQGLPYQLQHLLGAGAMGEVWKAWDSRLCRHVAIKFLAPSLSADLQAQQRFRREVLAAGALNHPHILTVYDCGESQGRPFLVSEFIEGTDLRTTLDKGPVPQEQALEWTRQALAGLEAAHAAGILHRDLKPENLVIRSDGYLKIIDFGLAKFLHRQGTQLTGSAVVGTLQYMAPEQLQGLPMDGRADLFSLATVVYEMVQGHPPFPGATMPQLITAILTATPDLPPSDLGAWLGRALQKLPQDRFATARDMLQALPLQNRPAHPVPTVSREASLIILPFKAPPSLRELADGVAEGLIAQLTRHVRVIASSSSRKFRGADALAAGQQLNVKWALQGALRRSGQQLRFTVALIDTVQGFQVWSLQITAQTQDLFQLEDDLTERCLRSLQETELLTARPSRAPLPSQILQLYHHGLQELAQVRIDNALPALRQVVAQRPDFAPALARLSQCLVFRALSSPPQVRQHLAEEALRLADSALATEPDNPEALVAKSMLAGSALNNDYELSRRLLRQALAAHPGHAEAASRLAHCHFVLGNSLEGERLARRGMALDPLRPFSYVWLCLNLQAQGRLLDAVEVADRALHLIPDSPVLWIAALWNDLALGRLPEARQFLEHMRAQTPALAPLVAAISATLEALEGKPVSPDFRPWEFDSRAALDLKLLSLRALACAGQTEQSLTLLRECAAEGLRNHAYLVHDPLLVNLHALPEFQRIVADMQDACQRDPEFAG